MRTIGFFLEKFPENSDSLISYENPTIRRDPKSNLRFSTSQVIFTLDLILSYYGDVNKEAPHSLYQARSNKQTIW